MRAAIGKELGKSPQLVDTEQLRTLFDRFSDPVSSETVDRDSFIRMVSALGIRLPPDEIRELIVDVDMDDSNQISFEEFEGWYRQVVSWCGYGFTHRTSRGPSVERRKRDRTLRGFKSWLYKLRPCKKFLPHFEQRALDFRENARFVRIYGNENASTISGERSFGGENDADVFRVQRRRIDAGDSGANVEKLTARCERTNGRVG